MIWIYAAILGRLAFAGCNVLDSHYSKGFFKSSNSQNIFGAFYFSVFTIIYFLIVRPALPAGDMLPWLIVSGSLLSYYLLPYYMALKLSDSSSITSMFSLGRILVPVLAFFIVGETLSVWEYCGFAIVIGASVYLNYRAESKKIRMAPFMLMLFSSCMIAFYTVFSKFAFDRMAWKDAFGYIMLFSNIAAYAPLLLPNTCAEVRKNAKLFHFIGIGYSFNVILSVIGSALFFYKPVSN